MKRLSMIMIPISPRRGVPATDGQNPLRGRAKMVDPESTTKCSMDGTLPERVRPPKTRNAVLVLSILLLITGFTAWGQETLPRGGNAKANPGQGSFQLIRGRAAFLRDGGATWLDLGPEPITIRVGDTLKVSDLSRGELYLPDGSLVRLKSNAQLKVLANALQLQVGNVWCQFRKQPQFFQVVTPTTLCAILGTALDLQVDTFGKTTVRVFEGIVSVKAYSDQRKRNLVLQPGMWTQVTNRNSTEDYPRKFDLEQVKTEIEKDWGLHSKERVRLGPATSGLPPMRPPVQGNQPLITIEGKASSPTKRPLSPTTQPSGNEDSNESESSSVRENLNFFENIRYQRLREHSAEPTVKSTKTNEELRKENAPEYARGGGEYSLSDEQDLRSEIDRVQGQLSMLQEEIQSTQSEYDQLRQTMGAGNAPQGPSSGPGRTGAPPGKPERLPLDVPSVSGGSSPGLSVIDLQNRARLYQNRLSGLQKEQQRLNQRLVDLRNRLD